MNLDGAMVALAERVCPEGSSREQTLVAIAVLAGATAALAARLSDQVSLGGELPEAQRGVWADLTSLLLELADRNTPGLTEEDWRRCGSVFERAIVPGVVERLMES